VVTDHATLAYILQQASYKLTDRQAHWIDKLIPYANLTRILYTKGILHELDSVPRRPDFLPAKNMYMPDVSL
jgi:hypothetical protein